MREFEDDAPEESDIPEGAAVFPEIPADLNVNPLLLAAIHSTIFLLGSSEQIVHPEAGEEAVEQIALYMQRLDAQQLRSVQEDMNCLVSYAKREKWQRALIEALRAFLANLGVTDEGASAGYDDEEDE